MDWQALKLSFELGILTSLILIPLGILIAFYIQDGGRKRTYFFEAVCTLPLVLPPTVIGYYFLVGFGQSSLFGKFLFEWTQLSMVFSFAGILFASLIFNLPFAFLPILRGFEAIPQDLLDAAKTCGLTPWQTLRKIQLPLAWQGIVTALIMTFTHTLGEFGVVLMVGGNIPGQTRTISIAIFDAMQGLKMDQAGTMALLLLLISFSALIITQFILDRSRFFLKGGTRA
jgi:molybdate transport system permease protein